MECGRMKGGQKSVPKGWSTIKGASMKEYKGCRIYARPEENDLV